MNTHENVYSSLFVFSYMLFNKLCYDTFKLTVS
jgi:hypothetical protein